MERLPHSPCLRRASLSRIAVAAAIATPGRLTGFTEGFLIGVVLAGKESGLGSSIGGGGAFLGKGTILLLGTPGSGEGILRDIGVPLLGMLRGGREEGVGIEVLDGNEGREAVAVVGKLATLLVGNEATFGL